MARRLSAYNIHCKRVLKSGGTMKQAAASWRGRRGHRSNPWRDDPVGHSVAAVRGWRKRGKRAKASPKSWTTRQRRKAHVRKLPKTLKRYAKRFGTVRVAANPARRPARRRVRRNILTNIMTNPRKSVRRNILTNSRRRQYRRNPGIGGRLVGSFKQLLSKDTLIEGATITGGMLAAVAVPNILLNVGPVKGIAALNFARQGWGSYLVSLVAAGAAAATAGYFGKQKLARGLLIGGVAGTLGRIVYDVILPRTPAGVASALKAPGASGLMGLGADVERAVEDAVNAELARQGISDYLVPAEAARPGMADYLVPAEAANPGLGFDAEGGGDAVFANMEESYL